MISIRTEKIKDTAVTVPGSKSYTHRLLIAAALSNGTCRIENMLRSEDTLLTLSALKQMGIEVNDAGDVIEITGLGGTFKPCDEPIYLANSGTSMRLLTGICALGRGTYTLTGTPRMGERPIGDLLDSLNRIGVRAVSVNQNNCPPVRITGGNITGLTVDLRCHISSQYLSSLLLMAPCLEKGLSINITKGPVSKPYIDMTVDILKQLGIEVTSKGHTFYHVPGNQTYRPGQYAVEPDCSQASYFWGAAAVTGASIRVNGVTRSSRQGDVRFSEVLEQMGCRVLHEPEGITVTGGPLTAVAVDMSDMPDIVPTLAVVASFAKGTTRILNVAHLKEKESDRLGCVAAELNRMGIQAKANDSGLEITGGKPHGAEIRTYDDHRMAMSFSIAGLVVPGVVIQNEECVGKSFPHYWNVFQGLYR
ncbi:MAG: 3-phosphoshikimate 1-carboxyvinyltransferase [Desulfobacteraceae bacterium]|nr:MAG: 3-phosphoshikimate 1-carboxyvinyltransferase [Desulfobacteraceae bacterium]